MPGGVGSARPHAMTQWYTAVAAAPTHLSSPTSAAAQWSLAVTLNTSPRPHERMAVRPLPVRVYGTYRGAP